MVLQHLTVKRSEIIKCVSWAFLRLVSAASVARQSVFAANKTARLALLHKAHSTYSSGGARLC
eukprot:2632257-Pleurochrysis_carterae.AAC.1